MKRVDQGKDNLPDLLPNLRHLAIDTLKYGMRLAAGLALTASAAFASDLHIDQLHLPPGFHIEVLTDAVPNARQMALSPEKDGRSILYVGSMQEGKVYAVELEHGHSKGVRVIASGRRGVSRWQIVCLGDLVHPAAR